MQVVFDNGHFICRCDYENRELPKRAGFYWHQEKRRWYTSSPTIAARLREYCDETAKFKINQVLITNEPWAGRLTYPKDETPFPFQGEAARFALARNRSYLGLDPGLGKTIVAALILNADRFPCVYVCPPFLMRSVKAEFEKWLNYAVNIELYTPDTKISLPSDGVLIVPDSVIHKEKVRRTIFDFVKFHKGRSSFKTQLFVDEAHRFKSETALRTKAIFGYHSKKKKVSGIVELFDRVTFLSGTPMPNRPMELYPLLSAAAPETIDFMNKFDYGKEYCAGYENHFGWDFSGASNLPKLASKVIGPFMLRLRKADVLKSLPPKTEELVIIGDNLPSHTAAMDRGILEKYSPDDLMKSEIALFVSKGESEEIHVSTYRKELGIAKIDPAVEFISSILNETEESVLVFGIHKTVIKELEFGLSEFSPIIITGDTPMAKRHDLVKTFQEDSTRRLFIGNIQAAGTGFTLTKATRVIFVEFSWTPSDNDQASDRAHRIGQKDNVYCQYLVFKNSIDRAVMETIFRKKKVTAHV
jgi:SNF2 family DNA or RNA helicase